MAPRKSVSSLQVLTVTAVSRLIHSACKTIEKDTQDNQMSNSLAEDAEELDEDSYDDDDDEDYLPLAFDIEECKASVHILQKYLHRQIKLPLLWELIFQTVLDIQQKDKILDERIIFSTFIFQDVDLQKFKMPCFPAYRSLQYRSLVDFWIKTAPTMSTLIDVDLRGVECDEVIQAFSKACTNLESITLRIKSSATLMCVMQSNKKLRKLDYYLPTTTEADGMVIQALDKLEKLEHIGSLQYIAGDLLAQVDPQLKLRSLRILLTKSEEINMAINQCPDLEELHLVLSIRQDAATSSRVFQKLATSSLKISTLSLLSFNVGSVDFDQFLSSKGDHITDLKILHSSLNGSPESFLRVLSKCHNLTTLFLGSIKGWTKELFRVSTLNETIRFKKLQHLTINEYHNLSAGFDLATKCLENAEFLTTLSLELSVLYGFQWQDDAGEFEESLFELFTNRRMKQLKTVRLFCGNAPISLNLARHVLEACPEMTSLDIGRIKQDAKVYFQAILRNATAENLDFRFSFIPPD